jgi:hypothetical protein
MGAVGVSRGDARGRHAVHRGGRREDEMFDVGVRRRLDEGAEQVLLP